MQRLLDYQNAHGPPTKLALEVSAESVRLVFPVFPKWYYIGQIVIQFVLARVQSESFDDDLEDEADRDRVNTACTNSARTIWNDAVVALLISGALAIVFLLNGFFIFWYRRFGRVSRELTVTPSDVTLTYLGFRSIQEKHWSANEILSVGLIPT